MGTQSSSSLFSSSNPFFLLNTSTSPQNSQLSTILSQFQFISTYQDQLFQRCSILKHKQSQQLIVIKQMECKDQLQMNKLYEQFIKRKQNLVQENLIRLRYVLKKKQQGIFTDQYKLILFFDYILVDLNTEYMKRKEKKNYFTSDQINIIMLGAIKGYSALEKLKISNDKVRLNNIYFGLTQKNQTITKVIDTNLFPDSANLNAIKNKQQVQGIYLSPQQLRLLSNNSSTQTVFHTPIKTNKQGVYSFGICLLQLCLLQSSSSMYSYLNKSINYTQLQTRLNIVKNKYPLSVFYLIREMLQRNQDSRLSFMKLQEKLPTNVKVLPNNINLSVMRPEFTTKLLSKTKVVNPIMSLKLISPTILPPSERRMQSTNLASQYRPPIDTQQIYTNGNSYKGQKRDNFRHGKGKYTYSDGSYYFGNWVKGKMQGYGQLYDTEGNLQYQGQWKDDHYQGKGKLINNNSYNNQQDWMKYEGEFKSGYKEGFGEMIFKDGNKYKGQFRNDFIWGKGRLFGKNGIVLQTGIWERGVFISEIQ